MERQRDLRQPIVENDPFARYLQAEREVLIQKLGRIEDLLIELGELQERSIVARRKRGERE